MLCRCMDAVVGSLAHVVSINVSCLQLNTSLDKLRAAQAELNRVSAAFYALEKEHEEVRRQYSQLHHQYDNDIAVLQVCTCAVRSGVAVPQTECSPADQ